MDNLKGLNNQVKTAKEIIKTLPVEAMQALNPLITEFYNLITSIEFDMSTANKAMEEINVLRKNIFRKLNSNGERINSILNELQLYIKTAPPTTEKTKSKY